MGLVFCFFSVVIGCKPKQLDEASSVKKNESLHWVMTCDSNTDFAFVVPEGSKNLESGSKAAYLKKFLCEKEQTIKYIYKHNRSKAQGKALVIGGEGENESMIYQDQMTKKVFLINCLGSGYLTFNDADKKIELASCVVTKTIQD